VGIVEAKPSVPVTPASFPRSKPAAATHSIFRLSWVSVGAPSLTNYRRIRPITPAKTLTKEFCLIPAVTSPKHVTNFSLRVELDSPYSLVVDQLSSLTVIVTNCICSISFLVLLSFFRKIIVKANTSGIKQFIRPNLRSVFVCVSRSDLKLKFYSVPVVWTERSSMPNECIA
jgi:hypothetical protein